MAVNLLIAAAVLVWILSRQLQTRPVRERSRVAMILAVLGAVQTYSFISHHRLDVADLSWLLLSVVAGVGLAVLRAFTVRIWREADVVLRRGTWVTAALWLVALGQHILIDQFVSPGFGDASVLLYFGIVLGVQQLVMMGRVRSGTTLSAWSTSSPTGSPRR